MITFENVWDGISQCRYNMELLQIPGMQIVVVMSLRDFYLMLCNAPHPGPTRCTQTGETRIDGCLVISSEQQKHGEVKYLLEPKT